MSNEKRPFEDLLKEAPKAPEPGTVSLVGTVEQAKEEGKFVLTLTNGATMTLEVGMVKSYAVLGESIGRKIIRVDVDRQKVVVLDPVPVPWDRAQGVVPFPLATSQQVSPEIFALLQPGANFQGIPTIYTDSGIADLGTGEPDATGYGDPKSAIADYHHTGGRDLPR